MGLWDGTGDYSWMTQGIGGSGGGSNIMGLGGMLSSFFGGGGGQQTATSQQPTVWGLSPEDWRNIQYMTGAMGQGALKGTDMEWLGNMGAVSAQMAKNAQVSEKNKEFQALLSGINNPNASATAYTKKLPDGTTEMWKVGGNAAPLDYTQRIPELVNQQNAEGKNPQTPISNSMLQNLGPELQKGPSFFDPAQQPWWLRLGQQG